jgi:hypothetical protein
MYEKLYQELVDECDRLTVIIDKEKFGSEDWKWAYGKKMELLKQMAERCKEDDEFTAKEEERKITKEHNSKMRKLERIKLEQQKEIERLRNETSMKLEREKQKVTWQRVAFEMAKILIPLGISVALYRESRERMFDFEEHGRVTSTVGRWLSYPKINKIF